VCSVPHAHLGSTCYLLFNEAAHCKLACWAQERMLGIPLQLPTPIQAGPPLLLPLCVSCLQAALQAGKVPAQVIGSVVTMSCGNRLSFIRAWLSFRACRGVG